MKIEDECKALLTKYLGQNIRLYERNRLIEAFVKLIERKETKAREDGYQNGLWARPLNSDGSQR